MGFSSLIPKTGGRRSIENIVVPRELLRIVREKEHDFLLFWHSEVKKKAEIKKPERAALMYTYGPKMQKYEKRHEKQLNYAWTESGRIGENKKYSESSYQNT